MAEQAAARNRAMLWVLFETGRNMRKETIMNDNNDQETKTANPTGVESHPARQGGSPISTYPQSTSISQPSSTSGSSAGIYEGAIPTTLALMTGADISVVHG